MSDYLDARFAEMKKDGLLDLKFDIGSMPPDGGLKEPVRRFEDTFSAETVVMKRFGLDRLKSEVEGLYRAVDAGLEQPLDFGDASR